MQTERVTFLTTPAHKAALDTYATNNGQSVGHVLREATSRYLAQEHDEEAELAMLVAQVNEAIPKMNESIDAIISTIRSTSASIDRTLEKLDRK